MERLKEARTIAAERRGSSAAVTTDRRLIIAATTLLDSVSGKAVMLRTVGHASGISHDASCKHVESRNALLAVVATAALDSHTGRAAAELLCELAQEVPQ